MHTHFWGFLRKIFIRWKYPLTYLELQSQMTPCFAEKWENIFLLRVLYFACSEKPLHLFPLGTAKCTPKISKNFLSLHLFGIGMPKRNLFFRKNRKNFLKRLFVSKTSHHLFPLGEGVWGGNSEKRQKICPPGMAGRDIAVKMPVKQRSCSDRSSFFFGVAIQINCSIPYKSAKNIDFLLSLLYNYAVFLYLPESEGEKWIWM